MAVGRASSFLVWGWLCHPDRSMWLQSAACSTGDLVRQLWEGAWLWGSGDGDAGCEGQASLLPLGQLEGQQRHCCHPLLGSACPKLPPLQIIWVHAWLERCGVRAMWATAKVPRLCQQAAHEGTAGSRTGLFVSLGHFSAPMSSEIGQAHI